MADNSDLNFSVSVNFGFGRSLADNKTLLCTGAYPSRICRGVCALYKNHNPLTCIPQICNNFLDKRKYYSKRYAMLCIATSKF